MLTVKAKHHYLRCWRDPDRAWACAESLLIIGAGVLSFTSVVSQREIEVLRIGPGDHFGEIGMLTGCPAQATAKALAPVTTCELSKEDLEPVLEARPEVSIELSRGGPTSERENRRFCGAPDRARARGEFRPA